MDEGLPAESFLLARCHRHGGMVDGQSRLDLVLVCGFADLEDGVVVLDSGSDVVAAVVRGPGLLSPHVGGDVFSAQDRSHVAIENFLL